MMSTKRHWQRHSLGSLTQPQQTGEFVRQRSA